MTIPTRLSRPITVDGVGYRWRIRRRPTYSQGIGRQPLIAAVQLADRAGQVLLIRFPFDRPDSWITPRPVVVTPATVADAVRSALARGWRPAGPGAAFHLDLTG